VIAEVSALFRPVSVEMAVAGRAVAREPFIGVLKEEKEEAGSISWRLNSSAGVAGAQ